MSLGPVEGKDSGCVSKGIASSIRGICKEGSGEVVEGVRSCGTEVTIECES